MKLTIGVTGHHDPVANELPALRDRVRTFFTDLDGEFPGLDLRGQVKGQVKRASEDTHGFELEKL